ncbi:integral membrane protein [Aspergillus sp. HF37]|nr:integral membrane protein [Aspergillus sp. HF37]
MAPMILGTIFFAVRITAKSMGLGGGWWWDDFTVTIAWALAVVIYSLNASMIHYGFGKDMWNIVPMDNITKAFVRFYAYVLVYKVQISLAKISVCLFLLRIFQFRTFYYITYLMVGLNAAIAIAWVFADAFQCDPVHLAWTGWEKLEPGTCIDFNTSTVINAFVNIAVDFTMVLMPIYEVSKLNMSKSKKLGVALVFAVGLVVMVVAILRVVVLYKNSHWESSTAMLGPVVHWSTIECQVTIVCACLPMTRAVGNRLFPRLIGATTNDSSYPYKATPSGRGGLGGASSGSGNHIAKTVSYSVNYTSSAVRRGSNSSDVELVGVAQGSTKS